MPLWLVIFINIYTLGALLTALKLFAEERRFRSAVDVPAVVVWSVLWWVWALGRAYFDARYWLRYWVRSRSRRRRERALRASMRRFGRGV